MPTAETLEKFIARVEENAHAEAVEEFYIADASMQENRSTPRVGRDVHVANERAEWLDGTVTHMEELAYQRWEGERIAEEQFFYDPAQLVPKSQN